MTTESITIIPNEETNGVEGQRLAVFDALCRASEVSISNLGEEPLVHLNLPGEEEPETVTLRAVNEMLRDLLDGKFVIIKGPHLWFWGEIDEIPVYGPLEWISPLLVATKQFELQQNEQAETINP